MKNKTLGIGKYNSTNNPFYKIWTFMFIRCYNEKELNRHPSYTNCTVDERWYNFQNFAKWCDDETQGHWREGSQLNKDILVKNNRCYSPETCCFVPAKLNRILKLNQSSRGEFPIGVKRLNEFRFKSHIFLDGKTQNLGIFKTPKEAFNLYKAVKELYIKQKAKEFQYEIELNVYNALMRYKVEITD